MFSAFASFVCFLASGQRSGLFHKPLVAGRLSLLLQGVADDLTAGLVIVVQPFDLPGEGTFRKMLEFKTVSRRSGRTVQLTSSTVSRGGSSSLVCIGTRVIVSKQR